MFKIFNILKMLTGFCLVLNIINNLQFCANIAFREDMTA